ncbi:MAG: hypothetical protein M1148_04005 [Candidatus Thermoplasmatota archaeon]|nr:hypothetical protein [Candidatus Thermoplasmatota archaeon]
MSKRSMTRAVLREARRRKLIVFKRGRGTFYFDMVNSCPVPAEKIGIYMKSTFPELYDQVRQEETARNAGVSA